MKTLVYATLIVVVFSCKHKQAQPFLVNNTPITTEASEKIESKKILPKPKVVLVGKTFKIKAGKPIIYTKRNTTTTIKSTKPRLIENPKIILQSNFLLPSTKTGHKVFVKNAGLPEITLAKDAYVKDYNPYSFSYYSKMQGLKHDVVRCMIQDKKGNIWLGTDGGGVSRFDGKSFSHYSEKEGLGNNRIFCMMEDRDGNIWFGTDGNGVTRFDGKSFSIYTSANGLNGDRVYSILQDKEGFFWFGSNEGISVFDGTSISKFALPNSKPQGINCMIQDKDGFIWFGTDGQGLWRYDGSSITQFMEKDGLCNNYIYALFQDKNGDIWTGGLGGTISKYDGQSLTNFSALSTAGFGTILCIRQSKNGDLWFGSDGNGIFKLQGNQLTNFGKSEGLNNLKIWDVLQDNTGTLWFGTDGGGVLIYKGDLFTHLSEIDGLSCNTNYSILQDKEGNYWFAGYGTGVSCFNGKSFLRYTTHEGLCGNNIYTILQDKNGNIWFGSDGGGISKFDGEYFETYTTASGLVDNSIYCILQDKQGDLWFGTYKGISRFDGKSFTNYRQTEGLSHDHVSCAVQDLKGNYWFGTIGGGVSKFDGKNFASYNTKNGLSSNRIYCTAKDKFGNVWFGSYGDGLTCFDGKQFRNYSEKDGLINNFVFALLNDSQGNLWCSTRFGLSKVAPHQLQHIKTNLTIDTTGVPKKIHTNIFFKNYDYEDGFLGIGGLKGSICEDRDGQIWIGTNDRVTIYHPNADHEDSIPPNIQLLGIEIFYEKIPWQEIFEKKDTNLFLFNGIALKDVKFKSISNWYPIPEKLSLAYNNSFLSFQFIGITQHQNKNVHYQYKLEGLDKQWSAPAPQTEVTYGNLAPGSYTLSVRAMNNSGYWSNDLAYKFTIRPPWWKTYWFQISAIIFVILFLSIAYLWKINSLRTQKLILRSQVQARTKVINEKNKALLKQTHELNEINALLKERQQQIEEQSALMSQSNKQLLTLNATKDKFFSIIAHDLKNPFGVILGFCEILSLRYEKLSDEKRLQMVDLIYSSSKKLFKLLENLLQWAGSQTGNITFEPKNIELMDIVETNISLVENLLIEKKLTIHTIFNRNISIYADKNMITTVIRNLLTNAIKFTEHGGISITADETQEKTVINIIDTGIGIEKEKIEKIFEIHTSKSTPGTHGESGSGLGLIICKEFVERHGGTITVSSILQKGSTFTITLPKKPVS